MQNREKYLSKKTITKYNIYMVKQYNYINRVAMISLFTEKNKDATIQFFFLSKQTPNPNMKQPYFYLAQKIHNWLKTGEIFSLGASPPNPQRGLSLSASTWALKNLPLNRVIIQIKHN